MATGTDTSTVDGLLAPNDRVKPRRLRELRWSTWWGVLKRSTVGFVNDDCADRAAALTYYGVLALFPSAIVVVAMVGLVADTPQGIIGFAHGLIPPGIVSGVEPIVTEVVSKRGTARALVSFGVVGALWSASGYVGAFTRASNAIYQVQEGRKWYVLRPLQLALTAAALVLLAIVSASLVLSGPVARAVGDALRVGEAPLRAFQIGRWPLLVLIAALLLSLLFWIAPNVQQPRFRWLTVGGGVALLVWLLMSAGFGIYVANFGSYDMTYGSLGRSSSSWSGCTCPTAR